jgi:hypothetical protein
MLFARPPEPWPGPRPKPGRPGIAAVIAVILLIAAFCVGLGIAQVTPIPDLPVGAGTPTRAPTTVVIPVLGVRAPVVPVGRDTTGAIGTPAADPARSAGWFTGGPYPGEHGTAVIVGHIDTDTRPAVFHRLSTLRRGQLVEVGRGEGRPVTFRIDSVERFAKTAFPVGRIFGPADRARLALVTCGGRWVGGDLGYDENVIAFASLV